MTYSISDLPEKINRAEFSAHRYKDTSHLDGNNHSEQEEDQRGTGSAENP